MPAVIVATPGAANANSYATLAEANAYHETVIDPTVWDDADTDEKNRALIVATRALDQQITWVGYAATSEQALAWPRHSAITRNRHIFGSDVIPQEVKNATAELARQLLAAGTSGAVTTANPLSSLKAGPVNLVFREDVAATGTSGIPADVFQMIAHLARSGPGTSGVRSVPIVRT